MEQAYECSCHDGRAECCDGCLAAGCEYDRMAAASRAPGVIYTGPKQQWEVYKVGADLGSRAELPESLRHTLEQLDKLDDLEANYQRIDDMYAEALTAFSNYSRVERPPTRPDTQD